jgi:hypothetical protein
VKVINEYGQVVYDFYVDWMLGNWYNKEDMDGNLILVGSNGNELYIYYEYSWARGFIKKFDLKSYLQSALSINRIINKNSLSVYPNPTSGVLNIQLGTGKIEKAMLFDITGKMLKEFSTRKINISEFSPGIYLLKIKTKAKNVIDSKVVKF